MAEVDARSAEDKPQSLGRSALLMLRDLVVIFLIAILISFLVKTFLMRPFYIPSESMAETLQVNDRIAVSLLQPELIDIERGDIVVFEDPGGWLQHAPAEERSGAAGYMHDFLVFIGLAPDESHGYLVKRVIGLPGDVVACCNDFGQVTVNGTPINEPYLHLEDASLPASGTEFEVTVPEDSLWVFGRQPLSLGRFAGTHCRPAQRIRADRQRRGQSDFDNLAHGQVAMARQPHRCLCERARARSSVIWPTSDLESSCLPELRS